MSEIKLSLRYLTQSGVSYSHLDLTDAIFEKTRKLATTSIAQPAGHLVGAFLAQNVGTVCS